jgi:PIF1-like helicase
MIGDIVRSLPRYHRFTIDDVYNMALHAINKRLGRSNLRNSLFKIPMPIGLCPPSLLDVVPVRQDTARAGSINLNPDQLNAIYSIMNADDAANSDLPHADGFVLIGPGGSGKTMLYRKLIEECGIRGLVARVFATTDIAATLIQGGTTLYKGFGIPLNCYENTKGAFQICTFGGSFEHLKLEDEIL